MIVADFIVFIARFFNYDFLSKGTRRGLCVNQSIELIKL